MDTLQLIISHSKNSIIINEKKENDDVIIKPNVEEEQENLGKLDILREKEHNIR